MKTRMLFLICLLFATIVAAFFVVMERTRHPQTSFVEDYENIDRSNSGQQSSVMDSRKIPSANAQEEQNNKQTVNPIDGALARITKKPFSIFVTPKNSPVQPERFTGFHTGADLETNPDEQDIDVPVKILCDGKLLSSRIASGYGGVAVQSCTLDGQAVTVVYGHIRPSSVQAKVGDEMKAGDFLANLGTGYSAETDGERKHLHLGIHKGASINILGYVQNKNELENWIDPAKFLQ